MGKNNMNRANSIVLILTIILLSFIGCSSTKTLNNDSKESLFNGKDLTGWTINGTEKWYVENNELICESGPDEEYGYLNTNQKYKNFELSLEFKQNAEGNSGVFFRSSIEGVKISGWQVEVAPPNHDTGGIYESYGRGWLVRIPDEKENILKMGEWNRLKIRVVDDNVKTWLNEEPMVDFTDEKIGEGYGFIALQIHSGGGIKIKWKNIDVVRL
jgi:3-keto-disaccharide hydrolase